MDEPKNPTDAIIEALMSASYGLKPFNPAVDIPKDVGLGGPSTEYLAGSQDPWGNEFTYPQVWWMGGQPVLLGQEAAYDQTIKYEGATGQYAPRYRNDGAASFAAQNRSALGGAEHNPLFGLLPARNF